MILYHFCRRKDAKRILREGISDGCLVLYNDTGFLMKRGFQWLTLDGKAENQSWATRHLVKYSRTECRLTIDVPNSRIGNQLVDRRQLCEEYPTAGSLFDGWPGSENWRVFKGMIPKNWIIAAEGVK